MYTEKQQARTELDLHGILCVMWKYIWVIVAAGVLCAALAGGYTALFVSPTYEASATLYANNTSSGSSDSTSISTSDMSASARLVDTYAAIIMSDSVLDPVIEENDLAISSSKLAGAIEVDAVYNTEVFTITVTAGSGALAAKLANSIADIAPEKIAGFISGCSVRLVSYAKVPLHPTGPNVKRSILLGGFVGVALSMMALFCFGFLDTRIKSEIDLGKWQYPVLGTIPSFADAHRASAIRSGYKETFSNETTQ